MVKLFISKNAIKLLLNIGKSGMTKLALLTLLISSTCCLSAPDSRESGSSAEDHLADSEDMDYEEKIVIANNLFALDMYREVAINDENVFFSPWSLNSALAMTYEGARGETAREMRFVLHLSGDESLRRESFSSLDRRINADDSGYILSTANALWVDDGFPLESAYMDFLVDYYNAAAQNLDFSGAPEDSRNTINGWVDQKTAGKIMVLVPSGYISPVTRLVLTNAIYFNGRWANQFDESLTEDEDFFTADGRMISAPMMRQLDDYAKFYYLETRDMQMLQMPYEGENLSMTILLPKGHDIAPLEKSLSVEKLDRWRRDQKEGPVEVYLPKFKISADYFLAENLTNMGMPTAFTGQADFSGICPGRKLSIDQVIHQAYVDVSEAGTEAAAATFVGIPEGIGYESRDVPIFRADHPFIFLIQDEESDCILFMGKVSDPSEG